MSKIYYVMGKSSSGKDTIYKHLLSVYSCFRTIVPYTTRPVREGECDGVEYHFVDEICLEKMRSEGKIIEERSYNTKCGVWTYFTADDGQIDLERYDYLMIGTLESYQALGEYFGKDALVPLYIEVEDGERLTRALQREKKQQHPRYAEMCRRYLADEKDFSDENLKQAGITRRFENKKLSDCLEEIESYLGL